MIEYKRGPLDFHYSKTINPVNVGEREIAKMFCIALNLLRRLRREKEFNMDICFTVKGSCKILYNVEKFKSGLTKQMGCHMDINAEIKKTVARINADRKVLGLPKI